MQQFKNQFDVTTIKNIVTHVAIVAAASLVVSIGQYVLSMHFGAYDFLVLPLISSIISAAQQYKTGE